MNFNNQIRAPLVILRWFARLTSLISISLLLMMFTEEGVHPSRVRLDEWIGLFFFPVGLIAGMVVSWRKEGIGSLISMASLLGFYSVYGFLLDNRVSGIWFAVFASPAFLFLLYWILSNRRLTEATN